jgi:hypothetical protein
MLLNAEEMSKALSYRTTFESVESSHEIEPLDEFSTLHLTYAQRPIIGTMVTSYNFPKKYVLLYGGFRAVEPLTWRIECPQPTVVGRRLSRPFSR